MHQIYLTQGSFHIAAVASLLQHHIRVVILGLEVIRVMALVGDRRIGCDNGILRVISKATTRPLTDFIRSHITFVSLSAQ